MGYVERLFMKLKGTVMKNEKREHMEAGLRFVIECGGAAPTDNLYCLAEDRGVQERNYSGVPGFTYPVERDETIMVCSPEEHTSNGKTGANGHWPFYYTDLNDVYTSVMEWAEHYNLDVAIDGVRRHVVISNAKEEVLAAEEGKTICHMLLQAAVDAQAVLDGTNGMRPWNKERIKHMKSALGRDAAFAEKRQKAKEYRPKDAVVDPLERAVSIDAPPTLTEYINAEWVRFSGGAMPSNIHVAASAAIPGVITVSAIGSTTTLTLQLTDHIKIDEPDLPF